MSAAVFVSPRTSSEPMAFTPKEFIRGTAFAWIIFVLGAELAYAADAATPVPGLVYESFNGLTGEALFWSRVAGFVPVHRPVLLRARMRPGAARAWCRPSTSPYGQRLCP